MRALDTNILVYAFHAESELHYPAQRALKSVIAEGEPWGIPSPCAHEFLTTLTRKRYLANPPTMPEALAFLNELQHEHGAFILDESALHFRTLGEILQTSGVTGAKVHDAKIAAICRDHGVHELLTADRDFSWFPWLNAVNPLVA